MIRKTLTFIGSSSEGLIVANAIAANLSEVTECKVWTEGVFLPGRTFIETLEKLLDEVDYAILVATPDDISIKRDVKDFTMRDNVLLELGLFMAKLGRKRTYLVTPEGVSLHIPSDLLGVETAKYKHEEVKDISIWIEKMKKPSDSIMHAMTEAERELSIAMKRILVKRILGWTTKVHGILASLQIQSLGFLLEQKKFDVVREEMADRVSDVIQEYKEDVKRLGVNKQYDQLTTILTEAITALPFPEEAVISTDDVAKGIFDHIFSKTSIEKQIKDRIDRLLLRYKEWWDKYSNQIVKNLLALQSVLLELM